MKKYITLLTVLLISNVLNLYDAKARRFPTYGSEERIATCAKPGYSSRLAQLCAENEKKAFFEHEKKVTSNLNYNARDRKHNINQFYEARGKYRYGNGYYRNYRSQ
ncbi:hypothetical protein [Candidatus Liberibacter asiaticus]|uniref:hypothetical protein n=1 Tax=Liberibacter asiaticus TaxID=34021 RepID=UPI002714DF03|nr:hypothetical protein [Candidatus Liberibacter asiaticus]WLD01184.1 hypothetical protein PY728_04350 [Candidatus Liberibacter asiaticus]